MRGETLYPLSDLKQLHPDVHALEVAKYAGREEVLELRIPLLDVLWNDAVHLAPIHPRVLAAEWRAAGLSSPLWEREFFVIPVDRIDARRTVWFAYTASHDAPAPNDFAPFEPAIYEELAAAPSRYRDYLLARGRRPRRLLHFPYVPHVLVAAPIDTIGLSLVRAV